MTSRVSAPQTPLGALIRGVLAGAAGTVAMDLELAPRWVALTNNVMHWMYGLGWGAVYGIVTGSVCPPRVRSGLLFGTLVWTVHYIVPPLAKIYTPMWEYD